jgi:amino acid adenylation domain-containing protein/non-ribosomal peptide synthase protein (TIGR01720 family)
MTDVQRRIAALSPRQRAVLEARLAEQAALSRPAAGGGITPRDGSRPAPLAIQQQREWTFAQFRSANNIPGAFRVEGELDPDLLGRALTEIVARHEVLRSTVEIKDDERVQVVHPVTPVPVLVVDLSALTADEQRAEVRRRWRAEVETPFDPDQRQRLRICLLRLAEQVHIVLIAADHAAADLVSVSIMVREFAALYGSRRRGGGGNALAPLAIQYGDYAAWQRALESRRLAAEQEHWQRTLDGVPTDLALPADRPYPVRPAFAGATHTVELPAELTAALRDFGERESASLGVILTAASAVLLYRFTGRDDVVIGEIVSGRNRAELHDLIGCFVGALPMRVRVGDGQSLRQVVRDARDTAVTAYDHQDLPVDGLLDRLDLGPNASLASLIDMWLDVRTPETTLDIPGMRIGAETIESGLAPTPLTLDADPNADVLRLHWIYMTELFDAGTVAVLADRFQRILHQLVTDPETAVGQVPLADASPAVRSGAAASAGSTVVELFERRVALAPRSPAAVWGGVPTSYAELNRDADRLAHRLRARGVGPETPVAVLVDRSPRLAAAILGVLKSGGYYVPVDPAHPPERIAGALADADARVLVTEEGLASMVAAPPGGTVLIDASVPDREPSGGDLPDGDPSDRPDPRSLAYTVYTSGSTGRPKGAMIEHGSLATYARDVVERLGLGAGDRFLQFASPSFDVLAEELFPTWAAGGCVVFPQRTLLGGGDDLTELIAAERLTVIELPTAYWHEWVRELDRLGRVLPDCLRLVIIGGERALPERLAAWRRLGVPLMNCYGLTETTVTSTFFRLDPAEPETGWPNLPIGTPLPSSDLRVLDRHLRPVPAGGTGELYIGGSSVGRGYLGRPGLTAHRFVADPDPARPGQRLYRTGDLIRQRADGDLEFISRVDLQVKIRGFRVEPMEVESVLIRHPQVAGAVVSVHEPAPGDRRLVAYVVPGPAGDPGVAELRRFLDGELPAHLVPSAFVTLDALPLTSNGKVDRDRLPAPGTSRPEVAEAYVAPRSPVQHKLAGIVSAVVGLDRVGIHDNFFEVGGDSILAIQVVAEAQEAGLRLSPLDLFAHPTVAALAGVAGAGQAVDAEQADVSGPVPVAPGVRWFSTAGIADPHHWNRSVVLELPAGVESGQLEAAVAHLMVHHDGLRQRLLLAGDRTRVRIAPRGDPTPVAVHDLSGLDGAELDDRMAEVSAEMQTGLDPAVGPLVRFALLRPGGGRPDRVAIVAHRLVADAPSMRILVEDLRTALAQLAAGEEVALPPKTTSWQAWVQRLVKYAATPPVQSQRDYWSELTALPGGRLPVDHPTEPASETVATERFVNVALSSGETTELLAAPGALNCRIEEVLLAALSRTLCGCGGAGRYLVDVERHDRVPLFEDVDVSRTVGWFSRTHPVALTGDPDERPEATLKAVKEALRAVPSGGIGWQLLRAGPDPVPAAPAELAFSYLGHVDPPGFALISGPVGADVSPRAWRPYPVEVEASVTGGTLVVEWRYSESRHERRTVQGMAERYAGELRALIDAARHPVGSTHSPSDFPLARVDQAQLDDLLSRI